MLGVAGRDMAAAGSPESPILLVKGQVYTRLSRLEMSPTVPTEVIRENTNSQCRVWGGPTVRGSGELEVWGGTERSEVSILSTWEPVLWKDDGPRG